MYIPTGYLSRVGLGGVGQMKKRFQAKRHDDPLSRSLGGGVGRGVNNNWGNWANRPTRSGKIGFAVTQKKGFLTAKGPCQWWAQHVSRWRLAGRRGGGGSDLTHGWSGHKMTGWQGCDTVYVVKTTHPDGARVRNRMDPRTTDRVGRAMTIMDGGGSEGGAALGWSRSYLAAGWVGISGLLCQ